MKRLYFLLFCTLIGVQVFAQDKWADIWCDTWNVLDFDGMRFEETVITRTFRLKQDTIIGNQTYRQFSNRVSVRFSEDKKVYVHYKGFDDDNPDTPDLPTGEYLAYDFSAQVGDTLEVFSGLDTYSTYPCVVDSVDIDPETKLRTITLHQICRIDDGGIIEEFDDMQITWIEGVGSPVGFLFSYLPCGWVGGPSYQLLCAHKGDELRYASRLYDSYGCEYNSAAQKWADTWCNQWNVLSHGWYGASDEPFRPDTWIYQLGQDTIINNMTYKTLYSYFSLDSHEAKSYIAALRFTEDKQVFILYEGTEYLLYDFDVQVGDTLEIFGGIKYYKFQETLPHVVTAINTSESGRLHIILDAITTDNSKWRKRWIEGIGSLDGIIHNTATTLMGNGVTTVLCAYYNDECLYSTTDSLYSSYGCVYNDPIFSATEEVESPTPSAQKIMQNGQLLIIHEGKTYNVMGVEVGQ